MQSRWPQLAREARVSIRSPHRSEGRCEALLGPVGRVVFQSAPPTEVRGDSVTDSALTGAVKFQSAPPTEVRGDLSASACCPSL